MSLRRSAAWSTVAAVAMVVALAATGLGASTGTAGALTAVPELVVVPAPAPATVAAQDDPPPAPAQDDPAPPASPAPDAPPEAPPAPPAAVDVPEPAPAPAPSPCAAAFDWVAGAGLTLPAGVGYRCPSSEFAHQGTACWYSDACPGRAFIAINMDLLVGASPAYLQHVVAHEVCHILDWRDRGRTTEPSADACAAAHGAPA